MTRLIPILFVLLWSTGFIGAKYGLPFAEPFTFLSLRLSIAAGLLALVVILMKRPWPKPEQLKHIAFSGLLIHAGYLGGVFWAIKHGMPAGVAALITGLQPIVTAVFARLFLKEDSSLQQWLGLVLGLVGMSTVVITRMQGTHLDVTPATLISALIALFAISFGTIYQKRYVKQMPVLAGTFVQYASSSLILGILAFSLENRQISWQPEFIFALSWLIIVLSFGAVMLLMVLIERNAAAKTGSLFYLVPLATALEAYLLFGEHLSWLAYLGMFLAIIGVALVVSPKFKIFRRLSPSS
ncbi:MAG: DMT family transporter [Trueperaceae bacterium]|nr:DMT family transporter [Trueperaceae bacterium]